MPRNRLLAIDHLNASKETYAQHARAALYMARKAAKMAIVLVIHAALPQMFVYTATATLDQLNTFRHARARKIDPIGEEG
jgi:hypothetical protein